MKRRNSIQNYKLKIKNCADEKQRGIEIARKEYEKVKNRICDEEKLKIERMLDEEKWLGVLGQLNELN